VPSELAPEPHGCKAGMRRVKVPFRSDDLTIEQWTVDETEVIEVSWGGKNAAGDLQDFQDRVVAKLVARWASPSKDGMTTRTMNGCKKHH